MHIVYIRIYFLCKVIINMFTYFEIIYIPCAKFWNFLSQVVRISAKQVQSTFNSWNRFLRPEIMQHVAHRVWWHGGCSRCAYTLTKSFTWDVWDSCWLMFFVYIYLKIIVDRHTVAQKKNYIRLYQTQNCLFSIEHVCEPNI